MKKEVKERLLNYLKNKNAELPNDGLTIEKIEKRGMDFHETKDGKIVFDIERHPNPFGRISYGVKGGSPVRFHELWTYTYCPPTGKWTMELKSSEFFYNIDMLVDELTTHWDYSSVLQSIEEKDLSLDEAVDKEKNMAVEYYKEQLEYGNITTEEKNAFLRELANSFREKLKREIISRLKEY